MVVGGSGRLWFHPSCGTSSARNNFRLIRHLDVSNPTPVDSGAQNRLPEDCSDGGWKSPAETHKMLRYQSRPRVIPKVH